ncbi:DUF6090 family protein [Fulvivirga sedimenti]|uniref:Uncharacterized protein n=1 Tax=Fulvivirga sedimenti TaxID=2879465 RepID=A0A9X1KXA1_9BACT|nr:DUF6090 family protein [Fulvivirga sedimenti]MCA6074488.1 hypothetical protein [Fulvivirga sedimenti]MCA6075665.1 hypothetical protein [Fulvivirga sedimenti]MCA6076793.1 hypothetical protein [Fulvivirga sedimenti]
MPKLFRRVRQQILNAGLIRKPTTPTGKYIVYAAGEIFLVVVGILIALQINNWNENRKLQNEELKLLFDIKSNLETTLINLKTDTINNARDVRHYEKIEYFVKNDLPYADELDTAFGRFTFWNSPYITATAYNSLQSKGLDIIKNETLKNDIVNMYEVSSKVLTYDYDDTEWTLSQTVVLPFFSKHMRRLHEESLFLSRPNDFEALKKNDEFLNILSMLLRQRKRGIQYYKGAIISIEKLIHDIEMELNKRS